MQCIGRQWDSMFMFVPYKAHLCIAKNKRSRLHYFLMYPEGSSGNSDFFETRSSDLGVMKMVYENFCKNYV